MKQLDGNSLKQLSRRDKVKKKKRVRISFHCPRQKEPSKDKQDEYVPSSLKATTRGKRGRGIRRRVQSLTTVPKTWKEFLGLDANKKELFGFLAEQIPPVDFDDGKQVITMKGEQVLCSSQQFDTSTLTPCNHEEVDTRILIHAADASKAGHKDKVIRTVDTDVVIICIGMTKKLNINELWIAFGTGTSSRYLAVHDIASLLGPEKARSLPVFHAFTGCDSVSCFSGKGKKTAWITCMACEEATSAFLESSNNTWLRKLERFVVLMYDTTCAKMCVNEVRKQLFAQKGKSIESIAPMQAALIQHTRRAVYQGGHCWSQAIVPVMNLPCPSQWGWMKTNAG